MKAKAPRKRPKTGRPAKRVSALGRKRGKTFFRRSVIRLWWILRGTAAGAAVLALLYLCWVGAGKVMELESLSVRRVEVAGCTKTQPDRIRSLAGVRPGAPLLKVDLDEVRQRVITHPSVRDATVVRELPDTLRISVMERSSVAVVLGTDFALVDRDGVVLDLKGAYPGGYPVITGVSEPLVPGKASRQVLPALEVLASLTRSGVIGIDRISELSLEDGLVRVSLMGSGTILLLRRNNADVQVERLVRLVEAGVFDARSAGYDLRFEGRVIKMAEQDVQKTGKNGLPRAGG